MPENMEGKHFARGHVSFLCRGPSHVNPDLVDKTILDVKFLGQEKNPLAPVNLWCELYIVGSLSLLIQGHFCPSGIFGNVQCLQMTWGGVLFPRS